MRRIFQLGVNLLALLSASLALAAVAFWARGRVRYDELTAYWATACRADDARDDREKSWLSSLDSARGQITFTSDFENEPWGWGWCGVGGPPGRPGADDVKGEFEWSAGTRELAPYGGRWTGTFLRRLGFGEGRVWQAADANSRSRYFLILMVPNWALVLVLGILPAIRLRSRLRRSWGRGFQVEARQVPDPGSISAWKFGYLRTEMVGEAGCHRTVRELAFPMEPAAVLFAATPALTVGRVLRRCSRRRRGHCLGCGYDFRAGNERCPECGRPITSNAGNPT